MNKKIVVFAVVVMVIVIGLYVYQRRSSLNNITADDQGAAVTTVAPLSVSIRQGPQAVMLGEKVTFTAQASGGVGPYTYSWMFSNGVPASTQYGTWTAAKPLGLQPVNVAVKDSTGKVAISQTRINVISNEQGVVVSDIVTSKGNSVFAPSGIWVASYPSLGFTLTNIGKDPVYISKDSNLALSTTTTGRWSASSTVASTITSGPTTYNTPVSYVILPGGSKRFTYNYTIDNINGSSTAKRITINKINYGMYDRANNLSITSGLDNLYVIVP